MADTFVVAPFATSAQSYTLPEGFRFGISGKSHFTDFVSIGSNCSAVAGDPAVKLGVKGKIFAEGLRIKLEGGNCWADYVFNKNYQLPSLNQVSAFIQREKHLPGIPSARDIENSGLDVATMMKLQMEKIEELTLYAIEQQKAIDMLMKSNAELMKKLEAVPEKK